MQRKGRIACKSGAENTEDQTLSSNSLNAIVDLCSVIMPGNRQASVYIGNLDEKVDERVLYEIMVQAGPLVDIIIPRVKETNRHKGYAFAEFTSEDCAQYAVNLFTGLVFLHKKLLRFSISGQGKPINNMHAPPQGIGEPSLSARIVNTQLDERVPVSRPSPSVGYASSPVGSRSTLVGYPIVAAQSNYPRLGQRLDFSLVSWAQTYNAHLVSVGKAGVGSHFQGLGNPRFY